VIDLNITNTIADNKYVVFKLDNEFYGLDIYNVTAIERIQSFTRVPNSPEYIKGVINLRGEVVPVVDLRKRFLLNPKEIDSNSRIIIVSILDMLIGIIVDSSSEVIEINKNDIDSPPTKKDNISDEYVKGIGKLNNKLYILLDLEKTLGIKEIQEIV